MKITMRGFVPILPLAAGLCVNSLAEETPPITDPGWPREFTVEN
jgi:hypothetical protein